MLSLIAAVAKNNCIGIDNKLPWHIPEDFDHFKKLTDGKVVVMGRKTWESLPEKFRPLPNRKNVVVTRQLNYPVPAGVEIYSSPEEAITAHANDDIMICGGAQLYAQTIHRADRLFITEIHRDVDGDAFFPPIDKTLWRETAREPHDGFTFIMYERS